MRVSGGVDEATQRLLFWLKVPYLADVGLAVLAVALLLSGRTVGWWVLLFAAVRAVIGTIALLWIAPKMIAGRAAKGSKPE